MPCLTQNGQFISEGQEDVSRSLNELGNIRKEVAFACILKVGAGDGAQRLRVEIKQAVLQVAPG